MTDTTRTPGVRITPLGSSDQVHWTLTAIPSSATGDLKIPADFSATVPGEVHTDLLTAGAISDPFDGDNETRLAWIGRTDWTYRGRFAWTPGVEQRHDLVAEGLDTIATLVLNGTEIGRTANQHRCYRFDVTTLLREGVNDLEIRFEAPVTAAQRLSEELGERPRASGHPFNAIRKMASGYGWDWGPDLAGAGIWRPIAIESWSIVRLSTVRPLASLSGTEGVLSVHLTCEWTSPTPPSGTQVTARVGHQTVVTDIPAGVTDAQLELRLPDASPWWPRGYGEPTLYDVAVVLTDIDTDEHRDGWSGRVGFRNVTLSTAPDDHGSEFVLAVNGQAIYVKGANWIPDDALLTRLTTETYRSSIHDAVDAGMNLLRVWGGGLYESEDFYAACDELGVLVWQDFLFACAAYSEEEPLRGEVEAEARQAITRLSRHASLALWNGNNENIWGYVEWGWRSQLGDLSWGDGYYTEILPALVAELDPRTPYTPGSPFSFARYHHPNDFRHGTMHIWDVWNQVDYTHYRDYPARFVSEFGFQGPAAWSTLTVVVHDQPLDPYGHQMLIHQKAADGNGKLERGLGDHLPVWDTDPQAAMDDWHWLTSLNQARAVGYGIEHFRSHFPLNRGAVVWQLNDNWPVISWAAVDFAGIRKPLWHTLKRVYADRLMTVQPRNSDGGIALPTLVAHNDSGDPWTGEFTITRRSTGAGSEVLFEQRVRFAMEPRTALSVALDTEITSPTDPRSEFIEVSTADVVSAYGYFVEDTELILGPPADALTVQAVRTGSGYRVTLAATALVKDAALFPDRLDAAARVDSGLVTLRAGQSHTFEVTSAVLDEVALTAKPVLRTVNDLVAR